MKRRVSFAAIICGLALSLAAQNPGACIGKTVPLKPVIMMSCANATPSCLTDQNGNNGRWIWSCPASTPTPPVYSQPQNNVGDIPNALRFPPALNPLDTAIQIQQLRQLQLQNRQLQQQLAVNPNQDGARQPLDLAEVIFMLQPGSFSGSGEEVLLSEIGGRPPAYTMDTSTLSALRAAGASEQVIAAMMQRTGTKPPPSMIRPSERPMSLQEAYTCGYFTGMLSDMESMGLRDSPVANAMRATLKEKTLRCDDLDKIQDANKPAK